MNVSDFHFDLPDELIARYPLKERSASRLLSLDGLSGQTSHLKFTDLPDLGSQQIHPIPTKKKKQNTQTQN